jgi:cytochrome c556
MKLRSHTKLALALTAIVSISAGGVLAQAKMSAGARAAHARHENFEKMGKAFKSLTDELKKDAPDKALIAANAATIKTLTGQLPGWFPKGSGVEARPKSEAKAEIWSDPQGFSAAASNVQVEASKLNLLAQAGNMAAIPAQVKATGAACGACHKKYRIEKKK